MCGIIGRIDFKNIIDKEKFVAMRDTLFHRGPDGCGLYINPENKTALGHRRLSFLDLTEAGTQPMCNENKTIWLTINGEIYNYKELKKELQDKGHVFKSETDSEVVLHGYEEWGTDVLLRLNGMFAMGLWDENNKLMFLARDRFGIKPLYYYKSSDTFIFASEIKAILKDFSIPRQLNMSSFADFFTYRYVPSPNTIWQNIYKLPPAHYLLFKEGQAQSPVCYWELNTQNVHEDTDTLIDKANFLMFESVKKHIQSEVPVGSFLSGGYDSSALVYYLHVLKYKADTFSIGFENWDKSEHQYARIVAETFNQKNNAVIIGSESLNILEHLSYVYDEPLADISTIPTFEVSKLAAAHVKTVLSGEGADELFCGYTWHKDMLSNKHNTATWFSKLFSTDILPITIKKYSEAMAMGLFDKKQLQHLISKEYHTQLNENPFWFYLSHYRNDLTPLKQIQYLDIKAFMGELVLTKVDRASMANGLEVRVPFLENNLFDYIFNLNEKLYYRTEYKKFVLHENIKNHLPPLIMQRSKQGFVGPDSYYQNMDFYKSHLIQAHLIKDGFINKEAITAYINTNDHWRLWKVLIMELWYKKWVLQKSI